VDWIENRIALDELIQRGLDRHRAPKLPRMQRPKVKGTKHASGVSRGNVHFGRRPRPLIQHN
jgi:hypothetical protein